MVIGLIGTSLIQREWYLIDEEGIHRLELEGEPEDFWEQFMLDRVDAPWPEFSQVLVQASTTQVVEALQVTASEVGVKVEEVTDDPERWEEGLLIARVGEHCVLGEPGVELDERVMGLIWAEELLASLRCDGAYFGYDPAAGTLFFTRFRGGKVDLAWCDSLMPGPSYAMIFDGEGACEQEDPRRFALRELGLPESSPFLDRYEFLLAKLRELGLDEVCPKMDKLPIAAAMAVDLSTPAENDGS